MVNSVCIKTNNNNIISYLLDQLSSIDLDDVYISKNSFKNYDNVIIHYVGISRDLFYTKLCETLSNSTIELYESSILKRIIDLNYFYFTDHEKRKILDICLDTIKCDDNTDIECRKDTIFIAFLKYLLENKSLVLDGFINFRLSEYIKVLDSTVDFAVNKFLIEREYNEFIDLLKLYIDSKEPTVSKIHLIYCNHESILIDEFNNVINTDNPTFNAKYLSDITFSSNDYALNALLTLLPEEVYIHLIDEEDEFINTLKLIFNNRVYLCRDCNICRTYSFSRLRNKK